jgi:hemerythrin
VQELRRFLNKWLIGHIMTHDLRLESGMQAMP